MEHSPKYEKAKKIDDKLTMMILDSSHTLKQIKNGQSLFHK